MFSAEDLIRMNKELKMDIESKMDEAYKNIKNKELPEIIEKAHRSRPFCFFLAAFYEFYLTAEACGKVDIFMDGIEKTGEIILTSESKEFQISNL